MEFCVCGFVDIFSTLVVYKQSSVNGLLIADHTDPYDF